PERLPRHQRQRGRRRRDGARRPRPRRRPAGLRLRHVDDGRDGPDPRLGARREDEAEDPGGHDGGDPERTEGMILDVNAYLGHFPFRRLRHNTAGALLGLMDAKSIDRAVVSSAAAITYRNPQSGNEELAEEVARHRDRLIPFAVINPFYAGWRDDLDAC